ncbi:MAG TPA: hypothetical protein VHO49_03050 [Anaerolineales bacterium]|nr:hypothetical protein [Anaerolineales bacterium]
MLDANGKGRQEIQLPNDGYIVQINRSVSPDGNWLAYFTGSVDEPYDLALNLLNLSNGTTGHISKLIAPGFPENLEPAAGTLLFYEGDDCLESLECRMGLLQRSFISGIYRLDWSPDGGFLAFAAQIDGPSSDLHLYDFNQKTVRRITNDPQIIGRIEWAPNGDKILYENFVPGSLRAGRTIHLADPESQPLQSPSKLVDEDALWGEYGWFSENLYLFYEPNDTEPQFSNLNILDTDTGQLREVWPYTADFFTINKENKTVLLFHKNHNHLKATVAEGIYEVHPNGKYWKISDLPLILYKGQGPYHVLAEDYRGRVYNIKNDGSIELLEWGERGIPWVSPDGRWLLFRESKQLALYTNLYELVKTWSLEEEYFNVTWSPDSSGLFIFTNINAHYAAITDDQPRPLFEGCVIKDCLPARFIWLP